MSVRHPPVSHASLLLSRRLRYSFGIGLLPQTEAQVPPSRLRSGLTKTKLRFPSPPDIERGIPHLLARRFGAEHPNLPFATDPGTAALEKRGAKHERCEIGGVVVDADGLFVSTAAYMLAPSLSELNADKEKFVAEAPPHGES